MSNVGSCRLPVIPEELTCEPSSIQCEQSRTDSHQGDQVQVLSTCNANISSEEKVPFVEGCKSCEGICDCSVDVSEGTDYDEMSTGYLICASDECEDYLVEELLELCILGNKSESESKYTNEGKRIPLDLEQRPRNPSPVEIPESEPVLKNETPARIISEEIKYKQNYESSHCEAQALESHHEDAIAEPPIIGRYCSKCRCHGHGDTSQTNSDKKVNSTADKAPNSFNVGVNTPDVMDRLGTDKPMSVNSKIIPNEQFKAELPNSFLHHDSPIKDTLTGDKHVMNIPGEVVADVDVKTVGGVNPSQLKMKVNDAVDNVASRPPNTNGNLASPTTQGSPNSTIMTDGHSKNLTSQNSYSSCPKSQNGNQRSLPQPGYPTPIDPNRRSYLNTNSKKDENTNCSAKTICDTKGYPGNGPEYSCMNCTPQKPCSLCLSKCVNHTISSLFPDDMNKPLHYLHKSLRGSKQFDFDIQKNRPVSVNGYLEHKVPLEVLFHKDNFPANASLKVNIDECVYTKNEVLLNHPNINTSELFNVKVENTFAKDPMNIRIAEDLAMNKRINFDIEQPENIAPLAIQILDDRHHTLKVNDQFVVNIDRPFVCEQPLKIHIEESMIPLFGTLDVLINYRDKKIVLQLNADFLATLQMSGPVRYDI